MKSFSLGRVAQYARYYYVSNSKFVITLLMCMVGMPLLIGVLSRSAEPIQVINVANYLFVAFFSALFATRAMRERSRNIMEVTIPVSNEERMAFIVLNSAIVFPIMTIVLGIITLTLGTPFHLGGYSLACNMESLCRDCYFDWPFYVSIQWISSVCLLINIMARRNLFVAYLTAFVGVIAFFGVCGNVVFEMLEHDPDSFDFLMYIDSDKAEIWAKFIFCSMPIVFYALSYLALRKRQMKW